MSDHRPIIDPKALQDLRDLSAETDPRLLIDMIELFFETAPLLMLTINELYKKDAAEELGEQAHALKSLCGNFGALRLLEKCQIVESLAKSKRMKLISQELDQLRSEYVLFEGELQKLLADEKKRVA